MFGGGTVFKMSTNGNLIWAVSFNSTNGSNGGYGIPAFLEASLIQASDGNLYGVAPSGGTFGDGTVFQISTNGLLAVLHSFQGSDGANPFGLMQGRDGNLYGTTYNGGTDGGGTVYGGSGPAQLALALLADHLADDRETLDTYQRFKWAVIAELPRKQRWTLTSREIDQALERIREPEIAAGGSV